MTLISTGLTKLDEFLKNGLPIGCITDVFGASGTGKTQLLFQIAINSIKNGGTVLYLDTTGGFRPERIMEIQKQYNLDYNALNKITISRIRNTSEQLKALEKIRYSDFSLVVIDNITDLFSYEYDEDESIFQKNSLFMRFMHDLALISIKKKIPIVVTNMIRHINGKETENMATSVDLYTHLKIRLCKSNSKYSCKVQWLLNKTSFDYKITPSGLKSD